MNQETIADFPPPVAKIRRRNPWTLVWLIPLLAIGAAAWLTLHALDRQGTPITIVFKQGHGLKPGDTLQYRGIVVGKVRTVSLSDDLDAIRVEVLLDRSARDLARGGSQFWVVRPQVDISGASGLKTIIGANYLGVIPGQGPQKRSFTGVEDPPLLALMDTGGLEIVLTTPGKGSLRVGTPISYRQVVIGKVLSVGLAKDAGSVQARAYIEPAYTSLIRQRTRFWTVSGARWSAGFSGISLNVDSVGSLVLGGITLAIPPDPGAPVAQGHKFKLYDEAKRQWLEWLPFVALDEHRDSTRYPRPEPVKAVLTWRYKNYLYLTREGRRHGWVLPVEGGVIGPTDLLTPPQGALPDSAALSIDGNKADFQGGRPYAPGLEFLPFDHGRVPWPQKRQREATRAEDVRIVADPERPLRFIGAEHLHTASPRWTIDAEVPFDANWHGASVVSDRDHRLVGILSISEDGVEIARFLPPAKEPPVERTTEKRAAKEESPAWWKRAWDSVLGREPEVEPQSNPSAEKPPAISPAASPPNSAAAPPAT